jgi:hypothetical protein
LSIPGSPGRSTRLTDLASRPSGQLCNFGNRRNFSPSCHSAEFA